ncbi:MAG: hypothetical protein JJU11_05355 [Candidatus Sumerlaeia bacterium]|nr:hypothetical protein [Candidatus Sumerlaeia bacterium]
MMFSKRTTRSTFALTLLLAMVLSLPFRLVACDGAGNCDIAEAEAPGCCAPVEGTSPCPVHQSDPNSKCCFIDVGFDAEAVVSTARGQVEFEAIEAPLLPAISVMGLLPSPSLFITTAPRGSPRDLANISPASSSRLYLHWCVLLR